MAGNSTMFELPEFKQYQARFLTRANRFGQYRAYYSGKIYEDNAFKLAHKLYAQTKALLSFLARAVDLDVALVPGVQAPWDLADGTPEPIRVAQRTLYEWSSWDTEGDAWLEDGATLGEAMLKIVPDPLVQKVRMQRIKPEICMMVDHLDAATQTIVDLALIVDRSATGPDGKPYEYGEAITPSEIRTYYNGEPHGYNGNPDRYDNPLGFVPIVATRNDAECRPTFAKCLPSLDSVNELASYLGNIIGRHAEPQWAAIGAEQGDLVKSGDNVWFFPAGAQIEALLAQVDVAGALAFIQEIKGEVKSNLPELAFDDLRSKDQIAAETLEIQLIELDAKIWKMRRRYDAGLVDAHQMAALAAVQTGVPDLAVLLAPHTFDWKRPVRPISEMEQIQLEEARLNLALLASSQSGDGMTTAVSGGSSAPLSGIQIQSATGILDQVSGGEISPSLAVELLSSLGISQERAQAMVSDAQSFKKGA